MRSRAYTAAEALAFISARRAIGLNPEMAALVEQFGQRTGW